MTIQEALTKAREGGYQHDCTHRKPGLRAGILGLHAFRTIEVDDFFLDPGFWCALGRPLGWQHEPVWKGSWQRCLDHLAHGNTPASFFATLRDPSIGESIAGGNPMRRELDHSLNRASQKGQAIQETWHHISESVQRARTRAHLVQQTAQA